MSLFVELKRRNVFKVGIAYVVASWLLLQLAEVLTELLEIGPQVGKIVIFALIIGFVPALIFAWAFEMTPEGIKREHEVDRTQSITPKTGRKLDFVIIGMLVLVAGYFIWESRFSGREPAPAATEPLAAATAEEQPAPVAAPTDDRKSIVVLPFVNMSNDPDQEFFSDGLSEEILNALVKIKDLRVISRTSAFAFKGKEMSIPQIAEQLGVSHVLEGSVRKAGNDVRITAQLIEVETDSHLWSDAYSRSLENVFEIQEEISTAIAGQLQLQLTQSAGTNRPTASTEAYQLYLRGRHHYQARGQEDMEIAVDVFKSAVELDPDFDAAWANLAAALTVLSFYVGEGNEALSERSIAAANRAIGINPGNGFAHAVLGLRAFGELDYEQSISELELALKLNPNESNSNLWMAITLSSLGYVDAAIDVLLAAEQFDPVFVNLQNWMISLYLSSGDYEAAKRHFEKVKALDSEWTLNDPGYFELIAGDIDGAISEILRSSVTGEENETISTQAYVGALKNPETTKEAVAIILAHRKTESFYSVFPFLFRLGDVEAAFLDWNTTIAEGRGLRAANELGYLWRAYDRQHLAHPAIPGFLEETGLADYWRKHGNPDFCRVDGETIECESE